jgi:hypothetical protein
MHLDLGASLTSVTALTLAALVCCACGRLPSPDELVEKRPEFLAPSVDTAEITSAPIDKTVAPLPAVPAAAAAPASTKACSHRRRKAR